MVLASLMFATMGVCVKFASESYSAGEIVMYRGAVGVLLLGALSRARGTSLATTVPAMHFWRNASGVTALVLWFYAIGGLRPADMDEARRAGAHGLAMISGSWG